MASYRATPLEATRKHKPLLNLIDNQRIKAGLDHIGCFLSGEKSGDTTADANADQATRRERRFVKHALEKNYVSAPREKTVIFISMALPKDVQGNAEIIAKVFRELMDGPMKECSSNDEDCLQRAMEFLVSKEGKTWIQYWFRPNTAPDVSTPNKSGSHASTATSERVERNTVTRGNAATDLQLHERVTYQTPQVPAIHAGDKRIIASVQIPSNHWCTPTSSPSITAISSSAGRLSSVKQHKRSRSDPGQNALHPVLFFCQVCHTFHCVMT